MALTVAASMEYSEEFKERSDQISARLYASITPCCQNYDGSSDGGASLTLTIIPQPHVIFYHGGLYISKIGISLITYIISHFCFHFRKPLGSHFD